jgi:hypothetical protein
MSAANISLAFLNFFPLEAANIIQHSAYKLIEVANVSGSQFGMLIAKGIAIVWRKPEADNWGLLIIIAKPDVVHVVGKLAVGSSILPQRAMSGARVAWAITLATC